jgi:transglutaminase-like putative cysteine protease
MTNRSNNLIRWWDWTAVILALVLIQIAATRLVATKWTENLSLVQVVAFLGLLLGLVLGQSIYSRNIVRLFALVYGVFIIPWQLGLTLGAGIEWVERLQSLRGRIALVLQELVQRAPITDNLLFLLLMAIVFWILSVYAGFVLVRYGRPWRIVLPGGITAFVIHTFDGRLSSRSWYLAFYVFFALLLVSRVVFLQNRSLWKQHHTHTPPDVGFDMARVTALVALVAVLFSWNVPVVAATFQPVANVWKAATHPWMNMRDRFSFAFASLRASVGLVSDIYGKSLPLGLGTPLSNQVFMEVEAPRDPPLGVRYYWRARVYTIFDDDEWETGLDDTREFLPGGRDLSQPGEDIRAEVNFTFFPYDAISTLYVVPQPLWVSRPSDATMVTNPDGTIDLESFQAHEYIRPGERYDVHSSVSAVTVKDLRAAGTDYPQWVLERYLQVPGNMTTRTYELAQELAQGKDTPYDIAVSITSYLRDTISYQRTIDPPPAGVNRIDWFLFEYQKGYCNYYATSEVILLRSLGIPARLAVGFAQGERQSEDLQIQPGGPEGGQGPATLEMDTATFIVRQKDAHAWPEVYFPGIGWIEFEPTSGQDPLFRPSGEDLTELNQGRTDEESMNNDPLRDGVGDQPGQADQAQDDSSRSASFWTAGTIIRLVLLAFVMALLILVIVRTRKGTWVVSWVEKMSQVTSIRLERGLNRLGIKPPVFLLNWAYTASLDPLGRSYLEINRSLKRLGRKPGIQYTPAERADALIAILPTASDPTTRLLAEYQHGIYSLHSADMEAARHASSTIRKLSYLAILQAFLKRFQEPERGN